ncbi:FecR family protein [Caulobacter henricii]|uniref:Iron dicitrate transport regulator FecR n=1 Tax=Caulobacter henricii TaxID=69395 RepID=A0A0N7JHR5_9CAUL|nr:FecR domain-containing protein [Caulobacter henricii]ALL14130.1 iron dicitrate transport regulator FecR [Caulobacter henricii]
MAREAGSRREAVRQAAAQWVVRLDAPDCAPSERVAFEAWRQQGGEYEAAFEREAAAWERMARLRAVAPRMSAANADLLAPTRVRSVWSRPVVWARAAAIVGGIGIAAAGVISTTASTAYATAIGERRVIVLSDDSRIELNTNSKVVVRYRNGAREVRLVKGEALFTAARDARPFVVRAGDTRLEASDSVQLAVRVSGPAALVTVRSGAVTVDQKVTETDSRQPAGVAAVYGPAGGRVQRISTADIDRALAWRQGAIALNGQTLEQAVAEFNRYNRQQISVDDPRVSGLRLAGYFQSTEPNSFVSALTNTFPVRATRDAEGSIHLTPRD